VSEPEDNTDNHSATEAAPSAASQLFDLRSIIALLFGVYGIILLVMGLFFESPGELQKAGGIDVNLWSGIVMIVVAALFALWAWLRPLVPPGERH
jgi:protein-S-isoprenylcysteine O-methyltransferase Ste14